MDTIAIFCAIDDFCKRLGPRWERRLSELLLGQRRRFKYNSSVFSGNLAWGRYFKGHSIFMTAGFSSLRAEIQA
ncbi:hypothetical protein SAMN05428978_100226 [Nitrosomonas sp. Nm34]|nr:hypothetical protein SAMN05428978_100226 [Nitrosomonas sp. Nm34]